MSTSTRVLSGRLVERTRWSADALELFDALGFMVIEAPPYPRSRFIVIERKTMAPVYDVTSIGRSREELMAEVMRYVVEGS